MKSNDLLLFFMTKPVHPVQQTKHEGISFVTKIVQWISSRQQAMLYFSIPDVQCFKQEFGQQAHNTTSDPFCTGFWLEQSGGHIGPSVDYNSRGFEIMHRELLKCTCKGDC